MLKSGIFGGHHHLKKKKKSSKVSAHKTHVCLLYKELFPESCPQFSAWFTRELAFSVNVSRFLWAPCTFLTGLVWTQRKAVWAKATQNAHSSLIELELSRKPSTQAGQSQLLNGQAHLGRLQGKQIELYCM